MNRPSRKIPTALLALFLALPLAAQNLKPYVEDSGKFGFKDKTGKIIIQPKFDYAWQFGSEGLAAVEMNGKRGFIDKTGAIVIPIQYDYAEYFREGLAPVSKNGKYGFIDKSGKTIIPFEFEDAWFFSDGLARVRLDGKCGFIDKSGKFVIPNRFDEIYWNFSKGVTKIRLKGKYGFIDRTGKFIIPARLDDIGPFREGLAMIEENGKRGFIDKDYNVVIPAQFDDIKPWSEGLAAVKLYGKYGYIDKTGKIVIPTQFESAAAFSDGLAIVDHNGKYYYIDKSGREYSSLDEAAELMSMEDWEMEEDVESEATGPQKDNRAPVKISPDTGYADRLVDVDSDIPQTKGANFGTYAVVIANENYRSVADVGNAANDGNVLHQYLTKTLGIPENNIIYCENASAAMMDEALSTLETKTRSAAALGKAFNVIFYYSGHGVPAEGTSDAYLLPVDVSPKNLKRYGFSLDELYRRLGSLEAQCVTVLLDACFSGAGRTGAMLADVKGVALEPKKAAPTGNMVVLSACSGSQTAHIFKEGKHGLFTYWLLRKLKETKGEVTLGELQEHLAQYVDYTATNRLNLPGQQPTLQVSPTLSRNWRAIPLR